MPNGAIEHPYPREFALWTTLTGLQMERLDNGFCRSCAIRTKPMLHAYSVPRYRVQRSLRSTSVSLYYHFVLPLLINSTSSATKSRLPQPVPWQCQANRPRRFGVPPLETAADTRSYLFAMGLFRAVAQEAPKPLKILSPRSDSSHDYDAASTAANLPSPRYSKKMAVLGQGFLLSTYSIAQPQKDPGEASGQLVHAY